MAKLQSSSILFILDQIVKHSGKMFCIYWTLSLSSPKFKITCITVTGFGLTWTVVGDMTRCLGSSNVECNGKRNAWAWAPIGPQCFSSYTQSAKMVTALLHSAPVFRQDLTHLLNTTVVRLTLKRSVMSLKPSQAPVVSCMSMRLYPYCLIQVGFWNGLERYSNYVNGRPYSMVMCM